MSVPVTGFANTALVASVRSMEPRRRLTMIISVIAALIAIALITRWAMKPSYITLYGDLPLDEVGRITAELTRSNVRYQLGQAGNEVQVPAADVARARVALAAIGLPSAGRPGLELFDQSTWGMTDFTQRVTYRRALEGELERTIRALRGVEDASVHLALSESSPLRRLERAAEAAVVVKLRPGAGLPRDVVEGITYLVANSVEQLRAENVAVLDESGRILTQPAEDSTGAGRTGRQLEVQREVEKRLEDKVEQMLGSVVGIGQVRVQVSARLNFDRIERTNETYDPDGQVLQSEQNSTGLPSATADESGNGTPQQVTINQYQNTRRVENVVGATGTISRLTVAVLVNENPPAAGSTPASATSAAQLAEIQSLVTDAVGLDSTRGDRVTVRTMPFLSAAAAAGLAEEATGAGLGAPARRDPLELLDKLARPIIALIGILAAFLVARRALKPQIQPAAARAALPASTTVAAEPEPPAPPLPLPSLEATSPQAILQKRLATQTTEHPDTVAKVVKAWMSEPA